MKKFFKKIKSPVGPLTLVATDKNLIAVLWVNDDPKRVKLSELVENKNHKILIETEKQLMEYFSRDRVHFDLPLGFYGTDFQNLVWKQLTEIPYGKSISYSELSKKIGNPKACRAVGGANGKNPLSIVVPCHRVIGADGKLTGFAGGLKAKEFLLKHEQTN